MELNQSAHKMGLSVSVAGTLVLFGIASGVMLAGGRKNYPELHTILDTGMLLMSAVLAMLLWEMSARVRRPFLRWSAISFAMASLVELVHALVTIEWSGALEPIRHAAHALRPSTWPPAAFILPIGLACSLWLMRRGKERALVFGLALLLVNTGFLLLFYKLPLYTPPTWLGITRPVLIPVPFLWGIVGWACWTLRSKDRLLRPLTLMATVQVLAHVSMLYSRAPHDTEAMIAHLGKIAGYFALLLSVMQLASVDMAERIRAERELAVRQQAEETLRKSHAQLRLIIEAVPSAMLMVNDKGLLTLVNQQAEQLFGYDRNELIGQAIEMLVPERYRSHHPSHRNAFSQHPTTRALGAGRDLYGLRKDRKEVPIEIGLNPIQTNEGAFVLASIIDITERKRVEQVLRESEERLQTIIQNLSEGLVISDLDGQLIHWNKTGLEMHGFSNLEEGLRELPEFQKTFELSTVDGSVLKLEEWPLARVIAGEHLVDYDVCLRRIDTDWQAVFSYGGAIVKEPNGRPLAFITITDITKRKQAEKEVRKLNAELEQRVIERTAQLEAANAELHHGQTELKSLFESLPGLYLVLTPELKIVSASDAYLKATMTTREGLLGRNLFELFPDNPDDPGTTAVANMQASIDRVFQNGASDTMAIQKHDVRRPDGIFEERYWSPINSPMFGADHQITYIIHRVEEVTEFVRQKAQPSGSNVELSTRVQQMEAEIFRSSQNLQASNQQLEAANKELESFSYSVSHDLRAPLRHINGFSQALLEDYADKLDETAKGYLQEVRGATQEMAQLIDDLLKLARVTRGEMHCENVNLSELARTVIANLKKRESQRAVAIKIEAELATRGDKRLLGIVLTNLLGNAWKFTSKQDQAEITFGSERKNGEISYFVRDNGAGFDMAYVDKLFGAFQRLHGAGEFEGTGIGLATVQRVINRHGGRVRAEGTVNEGATFYFTLPEFKEVRNGEQSDLTG